jgi:hypothetical protein
MEKDQLRERGLDQTLADSFPSSDPPSTIPDPLVTETETESGPTAGAENHDGPVASAANPVEAVLKSAAQKALDGLNLQFDTEQVEERILDQPVRAFSLAALSGFIVGGGLATRPSWFVLKLLCLGAAGKASSEWCGRMAASTVGRKSNHE